MKKYLVLLVSLLTFQSTFLQNTDVFHKVKINYSKASDLVKLANNGVCIDHGINKKNHFFIFSLRPAQTGPRSCNWETCRPALYRCRLALCRCRPAYSFVNFWKHSWITCSRFHPRIMLSEFYTRICDYRWMYFSLITLFDGTGTASGLRRRLRILTKVVPNWFWWHYMRPLRLSSRSMTTLSRSAERRSPALGELERDVY